MFCFPAWLKGWHGKPAVMMSGLSPSSFGLNSFMSL